MTVEFRCEHCDKNIQMPDQHAGRMGACPHCGHSLYVPLPDDIESQPLEITETDPAEEAKIQEEMDRTRRTMRRIWTDKAPAQEPRAEASRVTAKPPERKQKLKPLDPDEARFAIEQYVIAMAHSSLEEAEGLAAHLVGHPEIVNPIIKKAFEDGLAHPSLENIPDAVQKGLLKKLFEYLNQDT